MPIDIRVQGDPQSCIACADGLAQLAADTQTHAHGFDEAQQQSEHETWRDLGRRS